jgi:hypothetical protein
VCFGACCRLRRCRCFLRWTRGWGGSRLGSRLIKYFVAGTTARAAAGLVGVQPNTAIRFFYGAASVDCQQTAVL